MKNSWEAKRTPEYISQEEQEVNEYLDALEKAGKLTSSEASIQKHKINLRLGDFSDTQLVKIAQRTSRGDRKSLEKKLRQLWEQRANILYRNQSIEVKLPNDIFFKDLAGLESSPDSAIPIENIDALHLEIKAIDSNISDLSKRLRSLGAKFNAANTPVERIKISKLMAEIRQQIQILNRLKLDAVNKLEAI